MAFPVSPVNKTIHIENGMTYIFYTTKNRWELWDDSDATESNLDSEVNARKEADSDLQIQIWNNDSDIAYLNTYAVKLRGTVDVTNDLPPHTAIRAGDAYVVKQSGVVRSGWNGMTTKGVVKHDVLLYTDSDIWVKLSGEAGVADSEHVTQVQSAYNYLITNNVSVGKIHFGRKTDSMFVELDSDEYFLFEGSAGKGKAQMLDGIRNTNNSMFISLIGTGPRTTGARFDYYDAKGIKKNITVGAGGPGTSVTYTNDGVNVTAFGDSEFQYMGFQFASNIAVGDYLVMTASGFKSIIKTMDGVGFKRVPDWQIAIDSEQHSWKAADSDLQVGQLTTVRRDHSTISSVISYNGGAPLTNWFRNGVGIGNLGAGNGGIPFFTGGFITLDAGQTQPVNAVVTTTQSSFAGESAGVWLYIIRNGNVVYQAKQEGATLTNFDNTPKVIDESTFIQATGPNRATVGGPTVFWNYYDLALVEPQFHLFEDSDYKTKVERDVLISDTIKNLWLHDFSMRREIDSDLDDIKKRLDSDEIALQSLHTELELSLDSEELFRKRADSDLNNGHLTTVRRDTSIDTDLGFSGTLGQVWWRDGVNIGTLGRGTNGFPFVTDGLFTLIANSGPITGWLATTALSVGGEAAGVWVYALVNGRIESRTKQVGATLANYNRGPVRGASGKWYRAIGNQLATGTANGGTYEYRNIAEVDFIYALNADSEYTTTKERDKLISETVTNLFYRVEDFIEERDSENERMHDSDRHDFKAADSDLQIQIWDNDSDILTEIHDRKAADSDIINGRYQTIRIPTNAVTINAIASTTLNYTTATSSWTASIGTGGWIWDSVGQRVIITFLGTVVNIYPRTSNPTTIVDGLSIYRRLVNSSGTAVIQQNGVTTNAAAPIFEFDSADVVTSGIFSQTDYARDSELTLRKFTQVTADTLERLVVTTNYRDSDLNRRLSLIEVNQDLNYVRYNSDSDIEVRGIFFNNDSEGYLRWNPVDFTLDLSVNNDVTLQLGQENVIFVRNNSGRDMPNGTVVRVDGASGAEIVANWAHNDSDGASANTIGVTTQFIGDNNGGFVTTFGKVRGLDTSMWTEGDVLYLDSDGGMVNVKPLSPLHLVTIGYVVRSHPNNGIIFVNPQNGYELEELHDVLITNPGQGNRHNQVLAYDSDINVWKNISINTDFGDF